MHCIMLQHVPTAMNRDSQDTPEVRVERIDLPEGFPMHGPYPGELRTRVIDFVEAGGSRREAAEQFDVSVSSAIGA